MLAAGAPACGAATHKALGRWLGGLDQVELGTRRRTFGRSLNNQLSLPMTKGRIARSVGGGGVVEWPIHTAREYSSLHAPWQREAAFPKLPPESRQ